MNNTQDYLRTPVREDGVTMINKQAEKLFCLLSGFLDKTPGNNNGITDCLLDGLPELLHLCRIHSLQPILYYMFLDNVDPLREHFPDLAQKMQSQYIASVYYSLQQDAGTEEMADCFSRSGIPIVFFKGALLRTFYPEPQLRTMGDVDCLVALKDRDRAHKLMLDSGYECSSDKGDVWVYKKGWNVVEMHTRIAQNPFSNGFDYKEFFSDAMEHTEKNGKLICLEREYHFCFLIYHIAKHLYSTGAGIRMILDIAVFLKHYENEFDWDLAGELLRETGLSRTAGAVFQLCGRWFGMEIPWQDKVGEDVLGQLEAYIIDGGTFGFETHDVGDIYLRKGCEKDPAGGKYRMKFRILWRYLFPSADNMVQIMPGVERWRWLLPAAWVKRWWLGAFCRRKHSLHTVRSMFKDDDGRGRTEQHMLEDLGL